MLKQKLAGFVQLFRPDLASAAGVCVVVGEVLALGDFPGWGNLSLGFGCGFLLSATALILNDYFDLEVDRVNAPQRPLPSGTVKPMEVLILAVVTSLGGLALAALIGLSALIVAIIFWGVGVLYNWRLKQSGFPGNLMVSASVAITFILGGIVVGKPWNRAVWFFSLIAFLIDLGEEISGDAMDLDGDYQRGSRSLAALFGKQAALRVAAAIFALLVLISPLPYLLGWLGWPYLAFIIGMDVLIIFSVIRLLQSQTSEDGRHWMRVIYLGTSMGLLAFVIGQLL
jgi:geranylgeranylglycerol-phosphate geranylgeranyltransferase